MLSFREFFNKLDHQHSAGGVAPKKMGALAVVKDISQDLVKIDTPDLSKSVEPPKPQSGISTSLLGGRSFIKRNATSSVAKKPSHFLKRGS